PDFPIQDVADILQTVLVVFFRLVTLTGPFAIANLVFQAYAEFAIGNVLGGERQVKGAEGVKLAYGIHDGMHHPHRSVRPKIFGAVFDIFAGWENAREPLIFDDNPRVGLIIFQHDIVPRLMFLDQAVFQQPRVNLSINNGKSNTADLAHQHTRFAIQLAGLNEVGTDAAFEVFRFADIDKLAVGTPILVDPRPVRYLLKRFTVVKFGPGYPIS